MFGGGVAFSDGYDLLSYNCSHGKSIITVTIITLLLVWSRFFVTPVPV